MAHCTQPNCNWKGTQKGLLIHLGKIHRIRRDYDSETNGLASEAKCPIPGCGLDVPNLETHFRESHKEWYLSSGRFVFQDD